MFVGRSTGLFRFQILQQFGLGGLAFGFALLTKFKVFVSEWNSLTWNWKVQNSKAKLKSKVRRWTGSIEVWKFKNIELELWISDLCLLRYLSSNSSKMSHANHPWKISRSSRFRNEFKGQLISEWLFGVFNFQKKKNLKNLMNFCPRI